ncbi:IS1-like element transposase [Escherichia coli]
MALDAGQQPALWALASTRLARIMGVGLNTILRHLKNSGRSR